MTGRTAYRYPMIATALIVAVIIHGSLYPYNFRLPPGSASAFAVLIASWAEPPPNFGDLAANVLLYVPFGFFGTLAIRGGGGTRFCFITGAGLVLCTSVELAQFYDEGRVTNLSDVYFNTFGTALGAGGGLMLGTSTRLPLWREISASPDPVLLLIAMLGYHLFPYVPTIDLHKYWAALKPVFLNPSVSPYGIFRYFALWLTVSYLIGAIAGWKLSRLYVPLFIVLVLTSRIFIESLVLTPSEAIGAALACASWFVLAVQPWLRTPVVTAVLGAMVVAQRLEPFQFGPVARPFGWLPFWSFLHGSPSVNTVSFLEKYFQYGSLVWLAARLGAGLWRATLVVAAVIFVTSYAEVYLPGRSAEITDTVMVFMIAGIMASLDAAALARVPGPGAAPAPPPARLRR